MFFGGVGLAFSQLSINVVLNSISTGMDISGLWPRFINIRRGAYILAIVRLISFERLLMIDAHPLCSWVWHRTRGKSCPRLPFSSQQSRTFHINIASIKLNLVFLQRLWNILGTHDVRFAIIILDAMLTPNYQRYYVGRLSRCPEADSCYRKSVYRRHPKHLLVLSWFPLARCSRMGTWDMANFSRLYHGPA